MRRMSGIHQKLNKKMLTLVGVGVLLVGAIAANILINRANKEGGLNTGSDKNEAVTASATDRTNFFESFRTEREKTRSEEITYLDTIIAQGADADTLSDAQQQKLLIVENMEKELTVESLLKAKGFADAAVTLHTGSVNVILDAEELTDEQVAQVLDIVLRETGEAAENVKVSTSQQ